MFTSTGLAFIVEPGHLALMIPIIIFMIPIVGILTAHQRKMAEIIHARQQIAPDEIAALRQEMAELKELMHQQAIAMDNLLSKADRGELSSRLGS